MKALAAILLIVISLGVFAAVAIQHHNLSGAVKIYSDVYDSLNDIDIPGNFPAAEVKRLAIQREALENRERVENKLYVDDLFMVLGLFGVCGGLFMYAHSRKPSEKPSTNSTSLFGRG